VKKSLNPYLWLEYYWEYPMDQGQDRTLLNELLGGRTFFQYIGAKALGEAQIADLLKNADHMVYGRHRY
jgi:hypothetical protein